MAIREVKLGKVATVKGGKRLPKGINLITKPNPHPYIRVRDLNGKKTLELDGSFEFVDDETQKAISRYIVTGGDIVLSIVGTIGLVSVVGDSLNEANLTENCVKLTSLSGIDRDYLYYYLKSSYGQQEIARGTVGAVQAKLPIKNIQDISIPLPDEVTQRKIADILSSLDAKIEVIPNPDIYLELTNFYNQDGNKVSGRSFRFSPVIQNKIYLDLNQKTAYVVNALSNQLVPCGNLLDGVSDKLGAVTRLGGKCNLIYVSSANKAVIYAMELCQRIGTCTNKIEPELNAIAKQIEQKIHKEYYLARMIRHGIAYHIGALPAEIRAKIESLLRKGLIKYCFCTSTLLEGVNVPADNLFVFDNKKGPSAMSTIDAFNLIGRAGRVTLNEMGNVYILIDDKRKQKYFDEVLLKPLPNQELLPQKALEKKHKKAIVSTLLQGKTNLIEAGEKYSDRGFTETSYEYATKCLNMLVHDICAKNDSYIVRDFRKDDVLTPQNIIDIRRIFGEIVSKDDDINISALQKYSLYQAVSNTEISYPDNFDYHTCLSFLKKLSQIFNWPIYEKGTLGKGDRLNYYTVILLQWMEGHGLHEIIRGAISHYQEQGGRLVSYDSTYHLEKYNGSANHKNQVINEAMKDIEQIINYKFSMYFLRFSEAIIKIRGEKALINDWYEYVEYGTCNEQVIGLQKHGFLREQALLLTKNPYSAFVAYLDGQLKISSEIFEVSDEDMLETLGTVRINYPEIFVDGESE